MKHVAVAANKMRRISTRDAPMKPNALELLAPARTAEIGIEAIKHGADAVYIGGPAFGARAGAGNPVGDIARLCEFAHRFHARIFTTMNTIFDDAEIVQARDLAWQFYDAGVDALIVQDMGLLEVDLPPIQLHASTQTDIRDAAKARFLQDVGFSQIVLARELTLDDIAGIRAATDATLEFFVHGALCVAFSGQCFISHAHTGRSANRGECSQACRLPYKLEDAQGRIVAFDKHLLSMKDNDQSANLRLLADAGIRSFKIEGRYKDMAYVKNATAHYRQLIDQLLSDDPSYEAASSGRVNLAFTPQPEKTFNRGATDYFVNGRKADIGAFDTPKFAGEASGTITRVGADWLEVESNDTFHNGDGISYLAGGRTLKGLRINTVQGKRLFPNSMPDDTNELKPGIPFYRNRDQAFERTLEKESSSRRIDVDIALTQTTQGTLEMTLRDADGYEGSAVLAMPSDLARDKAKAESSLRELLGRLGATDFSARNIDIHLDQPWFIPAAEVNHARREALGALARNRSDERPQALRRAAVEPPVSYPENELSYLANVFNSNARRFYERHGVGLIADAYEANTTTGEVSLMITKHCLRFSYNLCPKEAKDWQLKGIKADPMTLVNGKERLTLRFDCKACEMHVMGKLRKGRVIPIQAVSAPH